MNKVCISCGQKYLVSDRDKQMLDQLSPVIRNQKTALPEPLCCPDCRQQKRLCWRNERKFYHRKCDLSGRQIISIYSPDNSCKVYGLEAWFSGSWNPLDYGREFNFSRPFFGQFKELLQEVPLLSLLIGECENCDYTNYSYGNKNCYLLSASDYNVDCYYCSYLVRCRNCVDCLFTDESERCYECTDCEKCYECLFCHQVKHSQNCLFCEDCQRCENCIGCINQRSKKYCIFNEQLSKNEYLKKKQELHEHLSDNNENLKKKVEQMRLSQPHRAVYQLNCENCRGNSLVNCKNCTDCYDLLDCEDCRYVSYGVKGISSMDVNGLPDGELNYECSAVPSCSRMHFCASCWVQSSECLYSYLMRACHNCFGCVSLQRRQYCILNKQYSKEEYEKLVPRIIEHMKKIGEWGHFFPISIAPFAYNETAAQEYFPLTEDQVKKNEWRWQKESQKQQYLGPKYTIPDSINEVSDDITDHILTCSKSGKPYKITVQELEFYKNLKLPVPKLCPDLRHKNRMLKRNPRRLWSRTCAKCGKTVQSTFAPDRPEIVYCEDCYLSQIY